MLITVDTSHTFAYAYRFEKHDFIIIKYFASPIPASGSIHSVAEGSLYVPRATKLGTLVCPIRPSDPVPSFPVKATYAPSSTVRPGTIVSGESVAEGSLYAPYSFSYHIRGSDEPCHTFVSQWATHAPSSTVRPDAVVSGEIFAEGSLYAPDETTWHNNLYVREKHAPSSNVHPGSVVSGKIVAEGSQYAPY
ncbi:hypothetical protein DPMN_040960 [Dreissena polymorpha]|uniref:Uncharacterized protein n=1 Tax=Dreissena polymorpha TaxID=45954 RepID=A0A9D4CVZ4_DREPO|nr:hypothetical protein DPMN_040960 [Dreissena polymorpha]